MRLTPFRSLALAFARTSLGRRYESIIVDADPRRFMEHVSRHCGMPAGFRTNMPTNGRVEGFEDLWWLFTTNLTNWGVISMDFAEASYLFRLARSLGRTRCLEIGRFKGGSTFLLAAATSPDSRILSIDNHSKLSAVFDGAALDRALTDALEAHGFAGKVELRTGDSGRWPLDRESLDLAFVDGDHSYEGVSRDFHNVKAAIKPRGHVVFHDARSGPYSSAHKGVERLVSEIESRHAAHFVRAGGAGSIVDFVRTEQPL
jgi:predicted O-methyltransferase YrrM